MPTQLNLDLPGDEDFDLEENEYIDQRSIEEKILDCVNQILDGRLPLDDRLWTIKDVMLYMATSEPSARRAMGQPGAPEPIRLPTRKGHTIPPRWVAAEVRQYAERRLRFKRRLGSRA